MSFKILHLITSLEIGGAQIARLNIIKEMQKKYPENSHFLGYFQRGPLLEDFKLLTMDLFEIKGWLFNYDQGALLQLQKIITANNITVIHSALWAANYITKIISKINQTPAVLDLHCKKDLLTTSRKLLDAFCQAPDNTIYAPVSNAVSDSFKLKNSITVTNGIDRNKFIFNRKTRILARDMLALSQKSFCIGGIGRLEPVKNFTSLIESFYKFLQFKQSGDTTLLIIGDGSEREMLSALIERLGIQSHCKIIPAQKDIKPFYDALDAVVFTSKTEGLPMVAIEALANGLPVLMPTHLCQPELRKCTFFKADRLPELLIKVLNNKNKSRKSKLDNKFSVACAAKNFTEIYQMLVEGKHQEP